VQASDSENRVTFADSLLWVLHDIGARLCNSVRRA
jgi:hypothetical protein